MTADELASWVQKMHGMPFTDHPAIASIPADRATWDAEQTRLAGASDPAAWAAAADGHAPLQAKIRHLAQLARIPLDSPLAGASPAPRRADAPVPYGLTGRELAVLRLVAAGLTNAQIGAQLYISTKTASVHVTSFLRKLGVANRVHAAAVAECAGHRPGP
jgi:DNA-binding CsgD family transcriptional regulator